jgi:hypothetical protein
MYHLCQGQETLHQEPAGMSTLFTEGAELSVSATQNDD